MEQSIKTYEYELLSIDGECSILSELHRQLNVLGGVGFAPAFTFQHIDGTPCILLVRENETKESYPLFHEVVTFPSR